MTESGIYALTPFTLQDYPGKTACIVWVAGCNMRCSYCHNPEIVFGKATHSLSYITTFLQRRHGLLDGLVVSGGEASCWDELTDLLRYAKSLGYACKIDTNGLKPDCIEQLFADDLIDMIALDYKAPESLFRKVTGVTRFDRFRKTLQLVCSNRKIATEIRTTVHTSLLDEADINSIIDDLVSCGYTGRYFIQNYCADNNRPTLGHLPPQLRLLDTRLIQQSAQIDIQFRNFKLPHNIITPAQPSPAQAAYGKSHS
jgi:pyruvate formate lyase activating enzyme